MLRDELSGLSTLVTLLDSVLFGPTEKEIKKEEGPNGVVELKGPDEDSQVQHCWRVPFMKSTFMRHRQLRVQK